MEYLELSNIPDTRDSILLRLRSASDNAAWEEFVDLYLPVILRMAKAKGLQDADAQDVGQRVLLAIASSISRWNRTENQIRFRHWLRRVTRNAVINALSRRPSDQGAGSTSVLDLLHEVPERDEDLEMEFELERRRQIFLSAAKKVQAEVSLDTWRVFDLTVLQLRSASEAALELNKELGAIYTAKCRVTERIRRAVIELEELEELEP